MFGRVIIACVFSAYCQIAWLDTITTTSAPVSSVECNSPNRVYVPCPPSCKDANITCEDLRGERLCEVSDRQCWGSCVCKEGFYVNENGKCVPEEYCHKCKKPNEVFECGPACDSDCSTLGKSCDTVDEACTEKCYCRKGYARNSEGECVRYSQCPGVPTCDTDKNEEYSCHRTCPPKTCESIISVYACPPQPECTFKCDCKDDLLRNRTGNGECVSAKTCFYEIQRRSEEWQKSNQADNAAPMTAANVTILTADTPNLK